MSESASQAGGVACPDSEAAGEVYRWVVAGQGESEIVAAMASQYPGADAGRVLGAVMARLRDAGDADPAVVTGWCIEATRDLYRRMLDTGEYADALRAVKQMAELVKNVPPRPRPTAVVPDESPDPGPGPRRKVRGKKDNRGGEECGGEPGGA